MADAVEDFRRRILRLDAGAEKILDAVEADPDNGEVLICAAILHLYGQTAADERAAVGYLDRAEAAGAGSGAFFAALRRWAGRDHEGAASALEEETFANPMNLFAAKICEFLYYILGQQHCGARFLKHMERLAPHHPENPDFLSMRSFAAELCGHFDDARGWAEASLERETRNPWAEHTLSHVLIRQGQIDEGGRRLRSFLPVAATCARPIHSHTAWHLALFELEHLELRNAEEILRSDIWGVVPDMTGEQIDAIALLWRLEMAGGSAEGIWSDIADHAVTGVGDFFMPFLTAHRVYALARAGRTEDLAAMERSMGEAKLSPVWNRMGFALVRAARAAGERRWSDAAKWMDPIIGNLTEAGGSDAQDDLFRQMYFFALVESGRRADAKNYLDRFLGDKARSPLDRRFERLTSH